MARKRLKAAVWALAVGVGMGGAAAVWANFNLAPMVSGEARVVRFESQVPLARALQRLQADGVVRNASVARLYARWNKYPLTVSSGSYRLRPGMTVREVLNALRLPIRQMVRLPETNWAARNAEILEDMDVTTADAYLAEVANPAAYAAEVVFPLPDSGSLEGYLYPDTYDFPPQLGAKGVVLRQLKAFESKVWSAIGQPKDLQRVVIIASLVQLEVAVESERPTVAGIIENRIRANMPLQIDATVLYAQGIWKEPTRDDLRVTDSPYNTYTHKGLPPGPICSPSLASLKAAANPEKHKLYYYVALPDGTHLFATTYDQHLVNVQKRRSALQASNR